MGADFFDNTAAGKSPRQAFNRLVEQAQYESGHGGYSGTIAEKHEGYVLFALPPRLKSDRLIDLALAAEDHDLAEDSHDLRWYRQLAADAKPGTKRQATKNLREAEKRHAKAKKDAARFWKSCGAHADLVREVAAVATGDKWGPAAAVELTGAERSKYIADAKRYGYHSFKRGERVFRFFGYASS